MGTRNVITVLGAVAGFAVAGPEGARWGVMLGSVVGNAVDPVQIEGARLEDLRATGYDYGTPIAHVYGTPRVPGIVAWASAKQEQAQTSGGKGGPETTSYTYKQDVLYELSANPIVGVRRIWANGKLVWSAADDASVDTLAASQESPSWDAIEVFTGAATQMPWSVYEAAVGVGNAPAMRGRGCVGITGLNLGGSGYMPQLTFEVVTNGTQGAADENEIGQLWEHTAMMSGASAQVRVGSVGWTTGERVVPVFQPVRYELRNDADNLTRSVWATEDEAREAGRALLSSTQVSPPSDRVGPWALVSRTVTPADPGGLSYIRFDYTANFLCNDFDFCGTTVYVKNEFFFVRYFQPDVVAFVDSGVTYSVENAGLVVDAPVEGTFFGRVALGSSDESGMIVTAGRDETNSFGYLRGRFSSSPFPGGVTWTDTAFGSTSALWVYTAFGADVWFMIYEFGARVVRRFLKTGGSQQAVSVDLGDYPSSMATDGNTLWVHLRAGGIAQLDAQTLVSAGSDISLSPLGTSEIGFTPTIHCDSDGNLQIFGVGNVYRRDFLNAEWDLVASFGSAASTGVPYGDFFHVPVYTDGGLYLQCDSIDGSTAVMTAYGTADSVTISVDDLPLSDVVQDLCVRSGLDQSYVDVIDLESQNVRALAITQISTARQVIEMLMGAYFFTAVEGANLKFVARGAAPIDSVEPRQLAAALSGNLDPAVDPVPITRLGDVEIPAQFAVTYANFSNDYQQATEYSDRLVPSATGVAASQLPLALTPQEAKRIADVNLLDAILRGTTVGPLQATVDLVAIEPADVLMVEDEAGNEYRVRVERVTDTGLLRAIDCVLDDATVLNSAALTDESYTGSSVVLALSNTTLVLGDWPIFRDADNEAGHYAAFAPTNEAGTWPGAALFRGIDDTGYTERLRTTERTAIGEATTALGSWAGGAVFDEINSVTVDVGTTLDSYTRAQILAGTAPLYMIGTEAIYARTATLVSPGVYTLTGLLRGRRGTEWAVDGHAVGDQVVLISPGGVLRAEMENGQLGARFSFKAPTFGRSVGGAAEVEFTNSAVGLKPFAPVDFRISRDASTDALLITWKRRTRLSCRFTGTAGINVPLGESQESYEIEIYSATSAPALLRTLTSSTASVLYLAADQAADDVLPGEFLSLVVYQLSALVGRGYPHSQDLVIPPQLGYGSTATLAGVFVEDVTITLAADDVTIGSHTMNLGDVDLEGAAASIAAVVNAGTGTHGYTATATGLVVTVRAVDGAEFVLSSAAIGSSDVSVGILQTAAPAGPGTAYVAYVSVTEATGTSEPIPPGITFTLTVQRPIATTIATVSTTTTTTTTRAAVLGALAAEVADEPLLDGAGYSLIATTLGGSPAGLFTGPVGVSSVFLAPTATSPFGLSASVSAAGSDSIPSDRPQIYRANFYGVPTAGEEFVITLAGVDFSYTVLGGDSLADVIDELADLIDASTAYNAGSVPGNSIDIESTTDNLPFTATIRIDRGFTVTVNNP